MDQLRLKGNEAFGQQRFEDAVSFYREALAAYDTEKEDQQQPPKMITSTQNGEEMAKCVGNLCLCLQKQAKWADLEIEARRGLQRNPMIAKAHCFLAMALVEQQTSGSAGIPPLKPPPSSYSSSSEAGFDAIMHIAIGCKLQPAVVTAGLKETIGKAIALLPDPATAITTPSTRSLCEAREIFGCGRGVFATSAIPCGTVVCPASTPFSVTYSSEQVAASLCHCCGVPATQDGLFTARTCTRCRQVAFCSEDCLATYLHRHATFECHLFERLAEIVSKIEERDLDVPEEFAELARHTIATLSGLRTTSSDSDRAELLRLESHAVEVSQSLVPIAQLMHELVVDEDPTLLTTLVGIVRCNSFAIADPTGLQIGQALHVGSITSLFNHSCAPSCTIDANQAIVTIRPVAVDEQLTISYIPQLYWPTKLRQDGLEERYFFRCRCSRCEPTGSQAARDWELAGKNAYDRANKLARATCTRPSPTEYHHQIVQNICGAIRMRPIVEVSNGDAKELEELLLSTLVDLPEHHYLVQDIRNCMTFVYSVLGHEEKVIENAMEELVTWEAIVPGLHPVKLAKLRNAMLAAAGLARAKDDEGEVSSLQPTTSGATSSTLVGRQLLGRAAMAALASKYLLPEDLPAGGSLAE